MQSRYYNPEWGRFINADGIVGETGTLLSHNMFAYCLNNPVNNQDNRGYFSNPIAEKINEYIRTAAILVFSAVATVNYNRFKEQTDYIGDKITSVGKTISDSYAKTRTKDIASIRREKKEKPFTKLYRQMDYIEYGRFVKSGGKFSTAPGKMLTKWFATNQVHAAMWGEKLNPNGYKVIEITIPTEALKGMYFNPYLDGIGPAYGGAHFT